MTNEPPHASDATLVETTVFELFYRTNFRAVSRFVLRRLPIDSHDDVVASTFVVAWRKYGSADDPSIAWLYRIASLEVAHERRRLARQPEIVELRDGDVQTAATSPKNGTVAVALRELSDSDAELLRLLVVEELSREAAARILGCTVAALNVRLYRARTRLADTMHRLSNSSIEDAPVSHELREKRWKR